MKYILVFIGLILASLVSFSQGKPNFSSPVKHNIILSGSFGELRSGHFHSGLDIKSQNGVIGDKIFSIEDGYVYRIKVEPGGYGNSLYIKHPNGFTSVYAHLHSFSSPIEKFVRQKQEESLCFTVDIFPPDEKFVVKKEEFIGLMGNSGKSFGPHLHFEIRNSRTDVLINPILFGIKPSDTRPPVMKSIEVYEFDELMNIVHEEKLSTVTKSNNKYSINQDTLFVNNLNRFSLSVNFYDRMNGASNKNGLYKFSTLVNDSLYSELCFDSIRFEDSNHLQLLLDQKKLDSQKSIHHLVNLKFDKPYSFSKSNRKLLTNENSIRLEIILSDYESNTSNLEIVVAQKNRRRKTSSCNYIINPRKQNLIALDNYFVQIDSTTFQTPQGITVIEKKSALNPNFDKALYLSPKYQNLSKPITIIYNPNDKSLDKTYCFVTFGSDGTKKLISNCSNDTICKTKITSLQTLTITRDTIAPLVKPLFKNIHFKQNSSIKFQIEDNLKPTKKSQYFTIEGRLNNVWILFEYDLKYETISYKIDKHLQKGNYDLELQVTDNQGNSACFFSEIKII